MPTATDTLKDLRKVLDQKQAELDSITQQIQVKGDTVVLPQGQSEAMKALLDEIQQIEAACKAIETGNRVKSYLDAPEGSGVDANPYMPAGPSVKSIGQAVIESEAWKAWRADRSRHSVSIEIKDASWWDSTAGMEAKDVWSLAAGTLTRQAFGSDMQRPIVVQPDRSYHLRELFPPEQTTAAVIWGIRQTGFVNAARGVRERTAADGESAPTGGDTDTFGKAPRSKITFENVSYPISEIRHIDYIHQTVLEDEPRLRNVIDGKMREGLRLAEDYDILHGDGQDPNIRGIFQTPGVQTFNRASRPGDPMTSTIRRALTRVQLAEYQATGVVVNPLDWEEMELEKDDMGRLTLVTSIQDGSTLRVWRTRVIPTTAIAQGTYLVGAFGMGAQLFERRGAQVDFSTENQDNFERRVVTVRAYERICLTVDRPEAFVKGSLEE